MYDDATVRSLYEACAGITPWRAALQHANDSIGASVSRLLVVDAVTRREIDAAEAGAEDYRPDGERGKSLAGQYDALWSRAPGEAVYLASPSTGDGGTNGASAMSVIAGKVREHRRHVTFVSFARLHAPFTPIEFAHSARYIGHLATGMKVAQQCDDMKTEAAVGARIMHASSRPMLLLGTRRDVLAANAPARAMLQSGQIVHARAGVVTCPLPANEMALSKVLDRFAHPHLAHDRRNRAAVRLLGAKGEPVLCSVVNMVSDEDGVPRDEHPVALLSFASLDVAPAQLDAEFLASLYDFTPAELRLVSSLLRGDDLIAIANANFVSVATVRSQLKSVFAKTNTHRQAQVVQLLLTALLL